MGICNILLVVVALQWTRMIPPGDDWGEGGGGTCSNARICFMQL